MFPVYAAERLRGELQGIKASIEAARHPPAVQLSIVHMMAEAAIIEFDEAVERYAKAYAEPKEEEKGGA